MTITIEFYLWEEIKKEDGWVHGEKKLLFSESYSFIPRIGEHVAFKGHLTPYKVVDVIHHAMYNVVDVILESV